MTKGTRIEFHFVAGRTFGGVIDRVINDKTVMVLFDLPVKGKRKPVMFTVRKDGEWRKGFYYGGDDQILTKAVA